MLQNPSKSAEQLAQNKVCFKTTKVVSSKASLPEVIARFPDKVDEYRKGKKGLIAMFMGEVMKASRGKADPKQATLMLEEKLKM